MILLMSCLIKFNEIIYYYLVSAENIYYFYYVSPLKLCEIFLIVVWCIVIYLFTVDKKCFT